jgi:parallel beta-helix repeat protein
MKLRVWGAIALAAFAGFALAEPIKPLEIDVDCAKGESMGDALERPAIFERRIVVTVKGTCAENVVIERDDVTLLADAAGGGIDATDATRPAILVNGARRARIEGLSIRGGLYGVRVTGSGAARIVDVRVREAAEDGIRVDGSSSAEIDDSTVESNAQAGITVRASATVRGSTVRNNGLSGVTAHRGGYVFLGGTQGTAICCGNLIENNGFDGVTVADTAGAILFGNTIRGNGRGGGGRFGVLIVDGASVRLMGDNRIEDNGGVQGPQPSGGGVFVRGSFLRVGFGDLPLTPAANHVTGNTFGIQAVENGVLDVRANLNVSGNRFTGIVVQHGSRARIEATNVSSNGAHGIFASQAASVNFMGGVPNTVAGNAAFGLFCADTESSFSGNTAGITGNTLGQVSCSGYSSP